jgi:hypothetical protein
MKYITVRTGDELLVTHRYFNPDMDPKVAEIVTYVLNGTIVKEHCIPTRAVPERPTP